MRGTTSGTLALVLLFGLARLEAAVGISAGINESYVNDGASPPLVSMTDITTIIPYDVDVVASIATGHSKTHVTRTQSFFSWEFDQSRPTSVGSYAGLYGNVFFFVDEDTSYSLAGTISAEGTGLIFIRAFLYDFTDSGPIVEAYNYSDSEVDPTHTLGSDDSQFHLLVGPLSGVLEPGHFYMLEYYAYVAEYNVDDTQASATGTLALTFGAVSSNGSVPEPSSLAIWGGLGILGAVLRARRRITRTA